MGSGGVAVRLCLVCRSDRMNLGFFFLLFLPLLGLKPVSVLQKWMHPMVLSAWAVVVSTPMSPDLAGDENFHLLVKWLFPLGFLLRGDEPGLQARIWKAQVGASIGLSGDPCERARRTLACRQLWGPTSPRNPVGPRGWTAAGGWGQGHEVPLVVFLLGVCSGLVSTHSSL